MGRVVVKSDSPKALAQGCDELANGATKEALRYRTAPYAAWQSALELRIEIFMRTDRKQNQLPGCKLVRLEPIGQQCLPAIELELVDEDAVQVAPLFFAERRVTGDGFHCCIQDGLVFRMQLFGRSRKGRRDQNRQRHGLAK